MGNGEGSKTFKKSDTFGYQEGGGSQHSEIGYVIFERPLIWPLQYGKN